MTHRSHVRVLAFDIYGTILNTSSITSGIKNHTRLDDEGAAQLSQLWRRYQLESVHHHYSTAVLLILTWVCQVYLEAEFNG